MKDFTKIVNDIANSSISESKKLMQYLDLMAMLRPFDNFEALKLACDYGISSAHILGKSEIEAQCYITRARNIMSKPDSLIYEMKNITLAPNWFQFALESEKKEYFDLDIQVKRKWNHSKSDIGKCYEALDKNPVVGAVAYCLEIEGGIYGQYYLQLKSYHFQSNISFYARIFRSNVFRWLGIHNYFSLSSSARSKLRIVKKDCLHSLHKAIRIFKNFKNFDYLAGALLSISNEHHFFSNPIRAKINFIRAERIIKKHNLKELEKNLALIKNRKRHDHMKLHV